MTNLDSIIYSCLGDCHKYCFHKFKYECRYDKKLKSITNIEIINWKISGKNMDLHGLNGKLKIARQNRSVFNQMNKLTIEFYSHLRYLNII